MLWRWRTYDLLRLTPSDGASLHRNSIFPHMLSELRMCCIVKAVNPSVLLQCHRERIPPCWRINGRLKPIALLVTSPHGSLSLGRISTSSRVSQCQVFSLESCNSTSPKIGDLQNCLRAVQIQIRMRRVGLKRHLTAESVAPPQAFLRRQPGPTGQDRFIVPPDPSSSFLSLGRAYTVLASKEPVDWGSLITI